MKTVLFVLTATPVMAFAQSPSKCAEMSKLKVPGVQLEITRAEWIAAGAQPGRGPGGGISLPAHCRVEGIVAGKADPSETPQGLATWHLPEMGRDSRR
jgi:hypothetical protein